MPKPTVILMHGLFRSRYSMLYLQSRLRKTGYQVYNHGYRSTRYTIEEQGDILDRALAARPHIAGEELHFVTHSLGSIVLRQFALKHGHKYRLAKAVMLGPPNRGSSFARRISEIGFLPPILGPAFRQLCDLKLDPATDRIRVGIVAGGRMTSRGYSPFIEGDNDGIVACDETSLAGSVAEIKHPGLHSFLMFYPSIVNQVIYFLEHGEFIPADR